MSGTRMNAKKKAAAAPLVFAKRAPKVEVDRIPLFEVDGTEYTIPAVVSTGEALNHLVMTRGMETEALRGLYLLRELAGPEALAAVLNEADMTPEDWQKLLTVLSEHVFGRLEAPGN
jgi:hypothetical protein